MSDYPEHDKLAAVRTQSQAQGELLDWLSERGLVLMRWVESDEETVRDCLKCYHLTDASEARCECKHCEGTHQITTMAHREGWCPEIRPVQELLAEYHGIDLDRIEAEKQAMLAEIRAAQQ
jgi:hypothetical protein